jgi:hypothetical protein
VHPQHQRHTNQHQPTPTNTTNVRPNQARPDQTGHGGAWHGIAWQHGVYIHLYIHLVHHCYPTKKAVSRSVSVLCAVPHAAAACRMAWHGMANGGVCVCVWLSDFGNLAPFS